MLVKISSLEICSLFFLAVALVAVVVVVSRKKSKIKENSGEFCSKKRACEACVFALIEIERKSRREVVVLLICWENVAILHLS